MERVAVKWPYSVDYSKINEVETDVLVIGGGVSGSWAAIEAARRGVKVAVVEQGDVFSAGPAGCDHWTRCYDNPKCAITPDEAIKVWEEEAKEYFDGIACYVMFNENYKTLCELEKLGAKVRDTEDLFKGAPWRDDETKLCFAYSADYRATIRVWGSTFRGALYGELVRLRVPMYNRICVTSLLTEGGKPGTRVVGATGVHGRTGEFYVFKAKATVLATGYRDEAHRLFGYTGFCFISHTSPNACGQGVPMAFKAGAELTRLDHFIPHGGFHKPAYYGGCAHTWYPCNVVDAKGKEIPWIDNVTGDRIIDVEDRYRSLERRWRGKVDIGKWIFKGAGNPFGVRGVGEACYPISHSPLGSKEFWEGVEKGEYTLPLYADLSSMPELERRAIFGLMVANEGKTWIYYKNMVDSGFDPDKDMVQLYELSPMPMAERVERVEERFAGVKFLDPFEGGYGQVAGGVVHDWDFKAFGVDGLFVCGEVLFGSTGYAGACTTGRWAGVKAAEYARRVSQGSVEWSQVERERERVYAPTKRDKGIDWRELNVAISKVNRTYINQWTNDEMLKIGLKWFEEMEQGEAKKLVARNPHELHRVIEVLSLLENSKLTMLYMLEKMRRKELRNSHDFLVMKLREEGIEWNVRPYKFWLMPPFEPTYQENYQKHKPW